MWCSYQDMLKNAHDVALFTHYLTAELVVLQPPPLATGAGPGPGPTTASSSSSLAPPPLLTVGPKAGCLLRSAQPAPDSSGVLCTVISPAELSYLVPYQRFGHTLELWSLPLPPPPRCVSVASGQWPVASGPGWPVAQGGHHRRLW
jgi:hypothetical protein